MDAHYFTAFCYEKIKQGLPNAKIKDSERLVNWARFIKSNTEINFMKSEAINNIVKTSINNNGIFRILLKNPKNHNVLSEEMMNNLQKTLDGLVSNDKARVIIISAVGTTFSAGHDLKELKKGVQNNDKGKNYSPSFKQ